MIEKSSSNGQYKGSPIISPLGDQPLYDGIVLLSSGRNGALVDLSFKYIRFGRSGFVFDNKTLYDIKYERSRPASRNVFR
ncbi:hypothetical protein DERP_014324 [Dermatophagoides pteronyssinus]|uniref:Uncharacterized protein n=1 Tax=Dermatophagoides pteronyssinus TaxID=6956 RepID=A0ABQ8JX66_DERPT|nr:hypothetical protein DERP_014324 [Dermatophagoides pteronyssinus]